jgi:putative proteasome-type protease
MTYCLALALDAGFVCVSDSRTNAGLDNVSTYSKMHRFEVPGERVFVLLSSGNLATTQSVVTRMRRDLDAGAGGAGLHTVEHMADAAAYLGEISQQAQSSGVEGQDQSGEFQATFILAGQIGGDPHAVYLVYPQGNYIAATNDTPYLQAGELKYGKPVLDRLASHDMGLTAAARMALVSMEAAMRSNVSVGPPVELVLYERDSLVGGRYLKFGTDDLYWRTLTRSWTDQLKGALDRLPRFDWEKN